ncbi:hypothetical protein WICMUC_002684 [Wickerhamomyces mucosus]|uniref:Luciferase-like domain-containing protein n=1 Tax=Wickerhamomyces mucosus TaxID=1378264 RepID=A0A9P8PNG2_9ASCO|nr:hypothetical protein WICMUC_002684 [Wickerhamomyces mucosus]
MTVPESPKKKLILNVIINGSPFLWKNPDDISRELSHSIDPWIELAEKAEAYKIHSIFIADHLTHFTGYGGEFNYKWPVKAGAFSPRVDPAAAVTAMALKTKSLSFGVTFSTISEHPYHFARRLSTLDHLTNGRVGWNIVASYLNNAARQLLNGAPLQEHDERYVKSEEYLNVVYKLLLSSWRDDAVVYDKVSGVFTDPDLVREINHVGKYFNVPGPHISEPSPQRFPLVIQAGTSTKGKIFAAKNAELIFVDGRTPEILKQDISDIRNLAIKYGRDPQSIKFVASASPILGKTHEEALKKAEKVGKYNVAESAAIALGGIAGVDLSKYELDDEVDIGPGRNNNLRSIAENVFKRAKGNRPTKREILDNYRNKVGNLVGTGEEVADEIERWIKEYDIDGFNLGVAEYFQSLDDIGTYLIPVLQKRGLFHQDYSVPGGTYRENVYGEKGQTFLRSDHPAFKLRWTSNLSQKEFESNLANP